MDAGALPEVQPPRGTRSCALLGCSCVVWDGAAAEPELLSIQCLLLAPSDSAGCGWIDLDARGGALVLCKILFASICDLKAHAQEAHVCPAWIPLGSWHAAFCMAFVQ